MWWCGSQGQYCHKFFAGIVTMTRPLGSMFNLTPSAWPGAIIYSYVGGNPISRADPMGLRDVIVAVWTSRFAQGSGGHVWTGELNGTTLTSQFPTPHGIEGANTMLTWLDTVRAEGRPADYVYHVNLPNEAALDVAGAASRGTARWSAFPDGSTSTNCANAATSLLRAGGMQGLNTALLLNHVNSDLLMRSWFGSQVTRLPTSPW